MPEVLTHNRTGKEKMFYAAKRIDGIWYMKGYSNRWIQTENYSNDYLFGMFKTITIEESKCIEC